MIIFAVLSQFDFVAKFTVKNLNKDFTNTGRGGTVHCMEDNFVNFFGSLIQLFMIDYHRLDTYT